MKPECTIAQGFGGNATSAYKNGGLLGHTGVDHSCGYGSPIHSYWDKEYVYKVLTKENPANDGSGFTGVFTIVEQDGECFEFLYGHCNPSPNLLGTTIQKGTLIGTEANNGEVYSNGVRITLDMQKNGDTRGTHRHDQKRILRKDKSIQPNTRYLTTLGGGFLFLNGFFYAIPNYNNGFNGCVDWTKPLYPEHFKVLAQAVKDFQIKEGIMVFANEQDLRKIKVGEKTLSAYKKYLK